jgi:PAS domain S-box-containing protein
MQKQLKDLIFRVTEIRQLFELVLNEDDNSEVRSEKLPFISSSLLELEKQLRQFDQQILFDYGRTDDLLNILIDYTELDFSKKAQVRPGGDGLDALGAGLNVLGEELQYYRKVMQDNEQKIKVIINSAPDPIIVVNSKAEVINWNKAAENSLGWSEDETIKKPIYEFLIPEPYQQLQFEGLRRFLNISEKLVTNSVFDIAILRKDQGSIDVELHVSRARLKNEYIYIAFFRDITERLKAEDAIKKVNASLERKVSERTEQLKISERKYRELFENSPLAKWIIDIPSLKFIDVNQSAINHYGYSKEEFLNMTALDLRPPEERELYKELVSKGDKKEISSRVWKLIKKDRSLIYVELKVFDLLFNGKKTMSVLANDITDTLEAQEALKHSESRFRKIFEANLIGLIFWNSAGDILDANDVFLDLVGYTRSDLISGNINWAKLTPPEYAEVDRKAMDQLKKHGVSEPFEKQYIKKNGNRVHVLIAATLFEDRTETEGIAYVLDIGKSKMMEKEILELNSSLENKVVERTEQLQMANKELESFSYSVSHDLRAPLRAITGYSNILLEDYKPKLDDEGIRLLNNIINNSQKMGKLIDDLLEFSRMGKRAVNKSSIDITKIACNVWEELKEHVPHHINFKLQPLGYAYSDAVLLTYVFKNLLLNAIKYTSKSAVPTISIGSYSEDQFIVCYIEDNGCGFDMTYYDKLFGVFQRLHSDKEYEGTGVGLAIVNRIIARLGGSTWAKGAVNEGATFYFTLPDHQNNH